MNDYGLKLSVALKDPDLEALRERREWLEGLANMRGAAAAGPGVGKDAASGGRCEAAREPVRTRCWHGGPHGLEAVPLRPA